MTLAEGLPHSAKEEIPKDKICLKLILVSGKTAEFLFPSSTSAGDVSHFVYENWPQAWAEEKETISSHQVLRLIYQGRFLHENVTLAALNLPTGKRTVMHLVPREKVPEPATEESNSNEKTSESSCCCVLL